MSGFPKNANGVSGNFAVGGVLTAGGGISIPNVATAAPSGFGIYCSAGGQLVVGNGVTVLRFLGPAGPNVTANSFVIPGGGTFNTSFAASVVVPAIVSGTAFTPSTRDSELFFVITAAGTVTMTYGPTTGLENNVIAGVAMPIGASVTKRIPASWKVIITLVTAAIAPTVQTV